MPSRFDRVVAAVVVAAWVAMTAQLCVFVAWYGHDLPRLDEWWFVTDIHAGTHPVGWVFARHNEHRYPLGRAIYLALHAATGHNYKAGMWLSVVLLSLAAAALVAAAKQRRGRSHVVDFLIPVLLLNAGHAENVTMGYQIVFTLTVGGLAGFLAASVWRDRLGPRRFAAAAGLSTLAVAFGGGVGWAFAPGLAVVTVWRVAADAQLVARPWRHRLFGGVLPAVALATVAFGVVEVKSHGTSRPLNDAATAAGVAFDFWTVSLGGAGQVGYPVPGLVVVAVVAESLVFAAAAWFARPGDRTAVAACAALVGGAVLLSLAVAATRGAGNESRYAAFGGLALSAGVVMRAEPGRRRAPLAAGGLVLPLLAAALAREDWRIGSQFAAAYEPRTAMLARDVRLGLPADVLAERHVIFPVTEYPESFRVLYESGHKSVSRAAPPRGFDVTPIALPAGADIPAHDGAGEARPLIFDLPGPMRMDALRVRYEVTESRYREVYRLDVPGNDDASAGIVDVWVVPGPRTMLFRVEGTLDRVVLRAVNPSLGLRLTGCEAVTFR